MTILQVLLIVSLKLFCGAINLLVTLLRRRRRLPAVVGAHLAQHCMGVQRSPAAHPGAESGVRCIARQHV